MFNQGVPDTEISPKGIGSEYEKKCKKTVRLEKRCLGR
jgi:hypothetical protein